MRIHAKYHRHAPDDVVVDDIQIPAQLPTFAFVDENVARDDPLVQIGARAILSIQHGGILKALACKIPPS